MDITVTFPLRIGQPFDQIWNSPLTLTVNMPELYLTELPRRTTSQHFENGILSAQFTIADTLRHPRITGYAQLMTARINSMSIDSRLRFDGNYGAIESLNLATDQNSASFFGDVNFADTWHLTARLHPNQPLYELGTPLLACASRLEIVPIPTVDLATTAQIGEIDFGGGWVSWKWSVTLEENAPDSILMSPMVAFTAKTFRFCSAGGIYDNAFANWRGNASGAITHPKANTSEVEAVRLTAGTKHPKVVILSAVEGSLLLA